MAALLPTILSDNEEDNGIDIKRKRNNKNSKHQTPKIARGEIDSRRDGDDISKASSGDEMDGDFEFGGLLVMRVALFCAINFCFLACVDIAMTKYLAYLDHPREKMEHLMPSPPFTPGFSRVILGATNRLCTCYIRMIH